MPLRNFWLFFIFLHFRLWENVLAWNLHNRLQSKTFRSSSPETYSLERCRMRLYDSRGSISMSAQISTTKSKNIPKKENKRKQGRKYLKRNTVKTMFQTAKRIERQGRWGDACSMYEEILRKAPMDSHTHLALARLEARREPKSRIKEAGNGTTIITKAQQVFINGTSTCPNSVHLWQAWAIYEESRGDTDRARELFEEALGLDPYNPYVCHAFGLMEKKLGNELDAINLFQRALSKNSTAALVCSLGEIFLLNNNTEAARDLYTHHVHRLKKEKDKVEVFLAHAWLEEQYFQDYSKAQELIHLALELSPESSLANVALARLEGRMQRRNNRDDFSGYKATAKRLAKACASIEKGKRLPSDPTDGRVFNALASLEVKSKRFKMAREILKRGIEMYSQDHALYQAAGKVEERIGNYTAARRFYIQSLRLEPSAPTLVAYALLELRHPETRPINMTQVKGLFEEALLLDPRHGPAYNAYGNIEFQNGNIAEARAVFERGLHAKCSDLASLYHGYGKFELSCGNVDKARAILRKGLEEIRFKNLGTDSTHRDRAKFLSHTLGMLELNSNHPADALDIFKDGLARCGNSSQLLLGAALCEMRLGKDDAARAFFERSVLNDRKHAQAWQAWGVMETRAGDYKTASTLFQCGIRSAPKHGALWSGYASLEMKKGNVDTARILFSEGLKKASQHFALYQGWALLELREGNLEAARKLISEALTRNKQNGFGWLVAAEIEQAEGNDGLVNLLLRRGIECAPNDAELYRKLGDHLVARGKINDAREVYEKGMEFNPLYAPLYHSLAELEARVFNVEGLSRLNKLASKLFNKNALEPAPSSSQAFGTRIKAKRKRTLPHGIAALAEKIVSEDGKNGMLGFNTSTPMDPIIAIDSMADNMMDDLLMDL